MTASLIFLLLSLIAIFVMVGMKAMEMEKGEHLLFSSLRGRVDSLIRHKFSFFRAYFARFKGLRVGNIFQSLLLLVIRFLLSVRRKIMQTKVDFYEDMKRRAILKNKGSVSFFLQSVSEHKKEINR